MALPNPFAFGAVPKPSFTHLSSPKNQSLNPGPGLPQAPQPQYSSVSVTRTQLNDTKHTNFGFQKNGFQSSQYQSFSCDRCDRSFRSQELLDSHIAEHIPCGINGCPFVAHPKIVEKHIQMQHETGLADQIMRLNTPEEIQKWREERKNRFPSTANVARRQAEQKEKLERGEVLYEPKKRFAKGRNERGQGEKGKGWDARRNQNKKNKRQETDETRCDTQQVISEFSQKLLLANETKSFNTTKTHEATMVQVKKELSDGELDSDNEGEKAKAAAIPGSNALAHLMTYASDSEEEGAVLDAKKPKLVSEESEKNVKNVEKEKAEHLTKPSKQAKRRKKAKAQKNIPDVPAIKELIRPKRLTLLQKLLQGEILHERNVILQCVHYIVQQNFFGFDEGNMPRTITVAAEVKDTSSSQTNNPLVKIEL
ncbi:nuclear fragile X mental retardation-interacting protein 1-like isoform X1 [Daphnia pulex]|uniref:nuclear fragile X mental retardation-interacting protein 1-like isoform X1 n=1 Tax=Daphnia pulex TaxID=6669 RepID=UPI001EDCEA17|nr:nuclear fragile X mental retardation-interacting protein 1-like isoform X1 [Daphnia pulex]